jgi:STE24 endopeptidase
MPVFIGLMLFTQTFWGPVDKFLSLLLTFNSRHNEFQADAFAVKLGKGAALASGLIKISIGNSFLLFSLVTDLTDCFCVENLDNMVPDRLYSLYHYSHPPLVERLRAIELLTQKTK